MFENILTTFNRYNNLKNHADLGEQLGNIGLGLLRIGFGKTITVQKMSGSAPKIVFKENVYNTSTKVAAVALFIIALPITIPLAGIGCIGMAYSKSHGQIFNSYNQSQQIPVTKTNKPHKTGYVNRALRLNTPKDEAATTIQKHFRGYLARRPHLPRRLYPQYQSQCNKAQGPGSRWMPRATDGKTLVYLPLEMPEVVLKRLGRKTAVVRFHQMREARSILESQHSSHLIIPKANLCQDFLVEQRLPINGDSYHNMGLYLSQPKIFDEAVREFTRLFSRVCINDLVGSQKHPLGHIAGVDNFVRYDNLPLYLVEENGQQKGKIGLIDLEHLKMEPEPEGLETLVRIFPLHLDVIKNEAKKLKMQVNEESLSVSAEQGKKYLQIGYTDHLNWLKQKGVSTAVSSQHFQVSPQRIEELTVLLKKELLKLNQGINDLFDRKRYVGKPQKEFFTEDPEEIASAFAKDITPLLIGNIKTEIEKHQNEQLSKIQAKNMTETQLVSLRSPIIERSEISNKVAFLIEENPKIKFKNFGSIEKFDIAEQLTYVVLEELVKGGEIFYFDPGYYANLCWIRY